jgi:hypothetical protein
VKILVAVVVAQARMGKTIVNFLKCDKRLGEFFITDNSETVD